MLYIGAPLKTLEAGPPEPVHGPAIEHISPRNVPLNTHLLHSVCLCDGGGRGGRLRCPPVRPPSCGSERQDQPDPMVQRPRQGPHLQVSRWALYATEEQLRPVGMNLVVNGRAFNIFGNYRT